MNFPFNNFHLQNVKARYPCSAVDGLRKTVDESVCIQALQNGSIILYIQRLQKQTTKIVNYTIRVYTSYEDLVRYGFSFLLSDQPAYNIHK